METNLLRTITNLNERLEVETQRADYFEGLYREQQELFATVDNAWGKDISINNGEEGWSVVVHDVWADGKYSHRRSYNGNLLLEALSAFQKGEKKDERHT